MPLYDRAGYVYCGDSSRRTLLCVVHRLSRVMARPPLDLFVAAGHPPPPAPPSPPSPPQGDTCQWPEDLVPSQEPQDYWAPGELRPGAPAYGRCAYLDIGPGGQIRQYLKVVREDLGVEVLRRRQLLNALMLSSPLTWDGRRHSGAPGCPPPAGVFASPSPLPLPGVRGRCG